MMRDKKIILLIILVSISIITLVGSSYALLTKSFNSSKLSMEVGTLKVDFVEGNAINLTNIAPMSDSDGMNTTPYTFTITNSGTIDAYYTVSNEEDTTNTLDTSYLKMKITSDEGYDSGVVTVKDLGSETYKIVNERQLKASKSVTYKLYLWVSSDAGNDIQNKTYQSKIVVSSTSNKTPVIAIGAAKDLIAKANREDLDYDSATDDQKKEMWTFSHEATEQTTALTDYRYIGADPNNYVTFNNELWRIIGVFNVDDGTGKIEKRLKIIRKESIGNYPWDNKNADTGAKNNYGKNNWSDARLNYLLNEGHENETYGGSLYWNRESGTCYKGQNNATVSCDFTTAGLTLEAREMIGDAKWYLGGKRDYTSSSSGLTRHWYSSERGSEVTDNSISWTGKVGLMYPSDYGYGTSGGSTTNRTSCLTIPLSSWYNYSDCFNYDWMNDITGPIWSISIRSDNYWDVFYSYSTGPVGPGAASPSRGVKPVVYLKSTINIISGTGSSTNPYTLG